MLKKRQSGLSKTKYGHNKVMIVKSNKILNLNNRGLNKFQKNR